MNGGGPGEPPGPVEAKHIPLPGWREPQDVLPAFASARLPALLLSGQTDRSLGGKARWSILCADPFEILSWRPEEGGDPFEQVGTAAARHAVRPVEGIPFAGGAVGFFSYEVGRCLERLPGGPPPAASPALSRLPGMLFGLYSWGIVWDHAASTWGVVATGRPEGGRPAGLKAEQEGRRVAARALEACAAAGTPSGGEIAPTPSSSLTRSEYMARVEAVRERIAAGDLYQVNLSQQLALPAPGEPAALFASFARHSPAPFSAYFGAGEVTILSASPERFVSLRGRIAESCPIKGTRPRGATPAEDARLAESLLASAKDRAENVMIVDLVRNDLGRVCVPGSVHVAELFGLESYASVHHLVSTVRGTLDPAAGPADLLRALFPAGSMTGAPKLRAMQVIEELEPVARGPYAGALGYLSFSGDLDLSVVIRTVLLENGRGWLHVGGGVVTDSDPDAEYRESLDKAASVRRALSGTTADRSSP